jgi:hypothetical protein
MSKFSCAFYAVITVKAIMAQDTLGLICFSYAYSIITYGTILGGNSPYSINIFRIKKRIIRIIINSRNRESCMEPFKNLNILSLYSYYIFSLILFVVKTKWNLNQIKRYIALILGIALIFTLECQM